MESQFEGEVIRAGPLEVWLNEDLVLANGRPLSLSVREQGVLAALASRTDRIVSRDKLFELVWNTPRSPHNRSADVYVHKLRGKLETALPQWRFIHTHVGFGYRFSAESESALTRV
ncbi:MAG: response regulator transcription factor [Solirubrobacterales bacterium]|nr:response regulator transcription factor [Solirubrobacterales bacterium]